MRRHKIQKKEMEVTTLAIFVLATICVLAAILVINKITSVHVLGNGKANVPPNALVQEKLEKMCVPEPSCKSELQYQDNTNDRDSSLRSDKDDGLISELTRLTPSEQVMFFKTQDCARQYATQMDKLRELFNKDHKDRWSLFQCSDIDVPRTSDWLQHEYDLYQHQGRFERLLYFSGIFGSDKFTFFLKAKENLVEAEGSFRLVFAWITETDSCWFPINPPVRAEIVRKDDRLVIHFRDSQCRLIPNGACTKTNRVTPLEFLLEPSWPRMVLRSVCGITEVFDVVSMQIPVDESKISSCETHPREMYTVSELEPRFPNIHLNTVRKRVEQILKNQCDLSCAKDLIKKTLNLKFNKYEHFYHALLVDFHLANLTGWPYGLFIHKSDFKGVMTAFKENTSLPPNRGTWRSREEVQELIEYAASLIGKADEREREEEEE